MRAPPISPVAAADLESAPRDGAAFHELPAPARDAKAYARWSKDYADWLYQTQTVQLLRSPSQKLVSHSGESEADFRARLAQGAREGRDTKAEALRAKYEAKVAALQQKLHTAQQAVDREENQERGAGLQAAVSVAGSILGGFLGRKSVSVGSITSVARGAGRVAQQHDDVARAQENVKLLQSQLAELQASFAQDAAGVGADGAATEQLDSVVIRPEEGRHRRDARDARVRAALAGRRAGSSRRRTERPPAASSISTRLSLNVGASRSVVRRCGVVACGLWPPA